MNAKWAGRAALLAGVLVSGCFPRAPEQALRRIDHRIYYLERLGVKRLVARVDCPHLDEHFAKKSEENQEAADYLRPLLPLRIQFTWDPAGGGRYDYLSVPAGEKTLRNFLDLAFKGSEILVAPPTEEENFRGFKAEFKPWQDHYRILGVNQEPKSDFTQYGVMVDRNFKILSKQYYSNTYVSTTVPTYREEDHRLLLTDLVTHQIGTTTTKHVISEVHLTYQTVQGFWLVKSISYVFKEKKLGKDEDGKDQAEEKVFRGPLLINYSDYQIETK